MDSPQGRLLISARPCGKVPVLESREAVRRGGSRDGYVALAPKIYCKEVCEQLAWELTKT